MKIPSLLSCFHYDTFPFIKRVAVECILSLGILRSSFFYFFEGKLVKQLLVERGFHFLQETRLTCP